MASSVGSGGVTPDYSDYGGSPVTGTPGEAEDVTATESDVEFHVAEGADVADLPDGDVKAAEGETEFWDACKQVAEDLVDPSLGLGRQIGGGAALSGAALFGGAAELAGKVGKVGGSTLGILYVLLICLAIVTGKISAQEAGGAMDAGRHAMNALKYGGAMVTSFLPSVAASGFQKLSAMASKTPLSTSSIAQVKDLKKKMDAERNRIEQERKEVDAAEAQRKYEADFEGKKRAGVTDTPAPATPNSVNVERLGPAADGVGPASTTRSSEAAARRRADTS